MNNIRNFDMKVKIELGKYIYALIDPRNNEIFYIGKGENDRVFSHFGDDDKEEVNGCLSDKEKRIKAIWKDKRDVEYRIIAHRLTDDVIDYLESAIIDVFNISGKFNLSNEVKGLKSTMLTNVQLLEMAAKNINPICKFETVFVFPINKAIKNGADYYASTRAAWKIAKRFLNREAYAVGVNNYISLGSYKIIEWKETETKGRYMFDGETHQTLQNLNWKQIIENSLGFWKHGGHLVVQFNGKGQFRFLYGNSNKNWQNLL